MFSNCILNHVVIVSHYVKYFVPLSHYAYAHFSILVYIKLLTVLISHVPLVPGKTRLSTEDKRNNDSIEIIMSRLKFVKVYMSAYDSEFLSLTNF